MRFWDSSAVVPLLVEEASTDELVELYREDEVVVWWGTEVECASALARLERAAELDPAAVRSAFRRLGALTGTWHLVEPGEVVKESAVRMLRVHDLRAADSLQLAAAWVVSEQRPASLEVVCRDRRLVAAAEREGFSTL